MLLPRSDLAPLTVVPFRLFEKLATAGGFRLARDWIILLESAMQSPEPSSQPTSSELRQNTVKATGQRAGREVRFVRSAARGGRGPGRLKGPREAPASWAREAWEGMSVDGLAGMVAK